MRHWIQTLGVFVFPPPPSPFKTYNSNKLQCKHILLQKNCFTQMTVPVRKSYHQLQGDRAPYTPETCLPCLLRPQLIAVELKLIKSTLKGSLVLSWAEIFTISFWLLVLKDELSVLSFKTGLHLVSLYNINLNLKSLMLLIYYTGSRYSSPSSL